jgi:hypothetical protein
VIFGSAEFWACAGCEATTAAAAASIAGSAGEKILCIVQES